MLLAIPLLEELVFPQAPKKCLDGEDQDAFIRGSLARFRGDDDFLPQFYFLRQGDQTFEIALRDSF